MRTPSPIFRLIFPFILGISFSENFNLSISILCIALSVSILCSITIFNIEKLNTMKNSWINGVSSMVSFFLIGSILLNIQNSNRPSIEEVTGDSTIQAVVYSQTNKKGQHIKFIAKTLYNTKFTNKKQNNYKVLCYVKTDTLSEILQRGDTILFNSHIQEIKNRGNPHEFSYSTFMARKGVWLQTFIDIKNWKLQHPYQNRHDYIDKLRKLLDKRISKINSSEENIAILKALTLGNKSDLNESTTEKFRAAGAMHVLAVSGLHVGVFYWLISLFFIKTRIIRNQLILASISISLIWIYALITGFSPSVQRAAIMFSLINFSNLIGRTGNIYNTLSISAFILLLYDPYNLFNIGFQFSYLAVVSIVYFQPKIQQLFKTKYFVPNIIWKISTVSIAAQIGVAPLSIYYFNEFPLYFLVSNIIVIPIAPIIIHTTIAHIIFQDIKLLPVIIEPILNISIWIFTESIDIISSLPYSQFKNIFITKLQTLSIYITIAITGAFIVYRNKVIFITLLLSLICFLSMYVAHIHKVNNTNKIIIYNSNNKTVIDHLNYRKCLCFHSNNIDSVQLSYITNGNRLAHAILKTSHFNSTTDTICREERILYKHNILFLENSTIAIGSKNQQYITNSEAPMSVDILILLNSLGTKIDHLYKLYNPKLTVMMATYKWKEDAWSEYLNSNNIQHYNIDKSGAYEFDLNPK